MEKFDSTIQISQFGSLKPRIGFLGAIHKSKISTTIIDKFRTSDEDSCNMMNKNNYDTGLENTISDVKDFSSAWCCKPLVKLKKISNASISNIILTLPSVYHVTREYHISTSNYALCYQIWWWLARDSNLFVIKN